MAVRHCYGRRLVAGLYDLVVLIDADAPEERRSGALSEIKSLVSAGGEIVGAQEWGVRRMAYEIDHRPEAEYHLLQIRADNALLERLRHSLRIMEGVLRFRIIRLRRGTPPPEPPGDQAARRDDQETQEGRVAARAAADAPAPESA
jgi:small subunit ribosomal protein S6